MAFSFKNLLKKKTTRVLSVDIGGSAIKLLVCDGKFPQNFSVLDYRILPLNTTGKAADVNVIQTALQSGLGTMNAGTNEARTLVSGRQVVVRVIEMPKSSREELAKAVALQIGRYVPINAEEAVYDCAPLQGLNVREGWMKCLLVASRRAGLEGHAEILRKSGLMAMLIEPEPLAVVNAFIAGADEYDKSVSIAAIEGGVGLIHIGLTHTDLCILRGRAPVICRSIEMGEQEIIRELSSTRRVEYADAIQAAREDIEKHDDLRRITGKFLSSIATEMRTSFDYCQREYDIKCERLYVTGGLANKTSTAQMLHDLARVDAYRYDPFVKVKLDALGTRAAEFRAQFSSFVPVLGGAVRDLSRA